MPTVTIEGWRFLPHSYSLWAMYFALDLMARPGYSVFFKDAALPDGRWLSARGVLSATQEHLVASLPSPPEGHRPDLLARVVFPYDFSPSSGVKTIVLGTSEYGIVPDAFVATKEPVSAVAARTGFLIGTPTKWSMDGFLRSGVKSKQLTLVPNGVDTEVFRPADAEARDAIRREFGWTNEFILLHNSSLGWNKNLEMMLDAMLALHDEIPSLRLVLKGMDALYDSASVIDRVRGQLPPEIRARLERRVTYIGESLPIDRMARLYQAADAYVCPYIAEGFNMPALEAAACGTPVVATSGGSAEDFLRPTFTLKVPSTLKVHRETGGKALEPSFDGYLAQIRRVVKDGAFRAAARTTGPAHVCSGWTWRHAVEKMLAATGMPGGATT